MRETPLIPFLDYDRIFRVVNTVLDGRAHTHRACIFFAIAGATILRDHYHLNARPVSGAAAFMVNESAGNVITFGLIEAGAFTSSADAFHCWVECSGWVLDFMAPLFPENVAAAGMAWSVPRRMFQRRASESGLTPDDIRSGADFAVVANTERTASMFANFGARPASADLCHVCTHWYRRPPKRMEPYLDMSDDKGHVVRLKLRGPAIQGAW